MAPPSYSWGNSFRNADTGERPRIAPPGRNGVVAFAVSGDITSPDQLNSSFNAAVRLGDRGAISAAVLAPDEATAQNNVLSRFFSTLKEPRTVGLILGLTLKFEFFVAAFDVVFQSLFESIKVVLKAVFDRSRRRCNGTER